MVLYRPGRVTPQATAVFKQPVALLGYQVRRPHELHGAHRRGSNHSPSASHRAFTTTPTGFPKSGTVISASDTDCEGGLRPPSQRPRNTARTPEPCTSGWVSEPEPQLLARVRSRRGSRRSQWCCSAAGLKASVSDMVKPWMVPG